MRHFNTLLSVGLSAASLLLASSALASSHREAPAISKDAFADNTDTYVFISPESDDNVVLAASWIPFQSPEGGPNYFEWDDAATYNIYVDTDGDAQPNATYTLTSCTRVLNGETFLYNDGPMTSLTDTNWNRVQWIRITETLNGTATTIIGNGNVEFDGSGTDCSKGMRTAPVNIGTKSTPDYDSLVEQAIVTTTLGTDTIKAFGGQTDDAFFVDLQVFDLLTLRGQDAPIGYSEGGNKPVDSLAGFNVHTMVVEVPVTRLIGTSANADPVIGVWSTTDRDGQQVSRLGMPLTNEVVLPYALKDVFNTLRPDQDLSTFQSVDLLAKSVLDPELGRLLCGLYDGVPVPGDTPNDSSANAPNDCSSNRSAGDTARADIFDIFLQGIVVNDPDFAIVIGDGSSFKPGVGFNLNRPDSDQSTPMSYEGLQPAEMIRLNTNFTPGSGLCSPTPSALGVLGGDACGFPNGRRLADDVTDIELLAVGGAAYGALVPESDRDSSFSFDPALLNVLRDGVDSNDKAFSDSFPYFAISHQGQTRQHVNPETSNKDSGGGALSILFLGVLSTLGLIWGAARLRRSRAVKLRDTV